MCDQQLHDCIETGGLPNGCVWGVEGNVVKLLVNHVEAVWVTREVAPPNGHGISVCFQSFPGNLTAESTAYIRSVIQELAASGVRVLTNLEFAEA